MTSSNKTATHLTKGQLLAGNTVWNLVGQILPLIAGLVTIPALIRGMRIERFGVLSLAWVVVGYLSLFDLGIGRALTKLISDKLGANEEHSLAPVAWTSLLLMFSLGLLGTFVIVLFSPVLVHHVLKIPQGLQGETLQGFYLLATSVPIVTLTAGFRGILEALQRFRTVNLIRIPISIFSFAGPLLVLPFSRSLVPVIAVLLLGRFIGCAAFFWACIKVLPTLRSGHKFDVAFILPLVRFGSWMTVNNLIGPLMFYVERFLVGALISVSAVAYYTTPVDIVLRITVIPSAVVGVLFPAFAVSLGKDPQRSGILLARGLKYIYMIVFPLALVIVAFAPEGLSYWLGPSFSTQGTTIVRIVTAGVFVNALSTLPFNLIQSAGRPDLTAWILAAEIPLYGPALWFFTRRLGIEGTAMVWTARLLVEALIVFALFRRLLPVVARRVPTQAGAIILGLALLYLTSLPQGFFYKATWLCVVLLAIGTVGWRWLLTPDERAFLSFASQRAGTKPVEVPSRASQAEIARS